MLRLKKQNKITHGKTWEFNGARKAEHIERSFTFKPIYDEHHTYEVSLSARNKNILTDEHDKREKTVSFDVPW